ncbi:tetratricopeptide repeat protein [Elstera sp.]|uniref:tetratricopeptide repeat protein n=1 Tax=Elstera sp. TaxID=1916664 RepID=UPI0037BFF6A7
MSEYISKIREAIEAKNFKLALSLLDRAPDKLISRALYYSLRADIFSYKLQFDRAASEAEKAISLEPNWAPPYNIFANALVELGQYSAARTAFDTAVTLAPHVGEFTFNRGQLKLLTGDWTGARGDYESRLLSSAFNIHSEIAAQPAWLGEPVKEKRLLLYWEQGQGDTIQFVRYVQNLEGNGNHVILEVQNSLCRLMQASFPNAQVISSGDALPAFDLRAAIPSLPWLLGETPDKLYAPQSYLAVPNEVRHLVRPAAAEISVGLVWAGNPSHINDRQRSILPETFLSLLNLKGVYWSSLQVGTSEKTKRILARAGVIDLTSGFSDFADTAAAIQALDLVITVDTSVAHLAGALGKPVWILLPFVPDWRWLLDRTDSPWYPSARLFRQPKRGDWASVLKEVKQALAEFRP